MTFYVDNLTLHLLLFTPMLFIRNTNILIMIEFQFKVKHVMANTNSSAYFENKYAFIFPSTLVKVYMYKISL